MQSQGGTDPAGGGDGATDGGADARPPDVSSALAQLAAERQAALERERWLRRQVEHERETLELVGKRLAGVLSQESGTMRFWRWLLDDLRSEAREQAGLIGGRRDEGLLARLRAWLHRRRRDSDAPPPPGATSE